MRYLVVFFLILIANLKDHVLSVLVLVAMLSGSGETDHLISTADLLVVSAAKDLREEGRPVSLTGAVVSDAPLYESERVEEGERDGEEDEDIAKPAMNAPLVSASQLDSKTT